MGTLTIAVVVAVALGVAAISSLVPAIRAARTSTVAALADAPRTARRRPLIVAISGRLPVPLLLGLRQLVRRPRRALLNAASVAVTVTGIVAVLTNAANTQPSGGIANLRIERLDDLIRIITVLCCSCIGQRDVHRVGHGLRRAVLIRPRAGREPRPGR